MTTEGRSFLSSTQKSYDVGVRGTETPRLVVEGVGEGVGVLEGVNEGVGV